MSLIQNCFRGVLSTYFLLASLGDAVRLGLFRQIEKRSCPLCQSDVRREGPCERARSYVPSRKGGTVLERETYKMETNGDLKKQHVVSYAPRCGGSYGNTKSWKGERTVTDRKSLGWLLGSALKRTLNGGFRKMPVLVDRPSP